MISKKLLLVAPALASVLLAGVTVTSASAATTDPGLNGSASARLSNGKYAEGDATWTRSNNHMKTYLHVETPFLFVGARGTITETINANTPFGPYPLWTVSHSLTACGKWDPTCSSNPSQTWDDTPPLTDWQKIKDYGDSIDVKVNVN